MPDDNTFLDLLWDHPEDNETWSVYADWLDGRGDAQRAEVVRLLRQLAAGWTRNKIDVARALLDRAAGASRAWLAALGGPPLCEHCWMGREEGRVYMLRFETGGVVHVHDEISASSGPWVQVGHAVTFAIDNADYDGISFGASMHGIASDRADGCPVADRASTPDQRTWEWNLVRVPREWYDDPLPAPEYEMLEHVYNEDGKHAPLVPRYWDELEKTSDG